MYQYIWVTYIPTHNIYTYMYIPGYVPGTYPVNTELYHVQY